jgi:glycine/D-amino acid oxidase-like deaminating enzyme
MPGSKSPVVVLGAGIVGVCTVSWLQREGHDVVVIDRKEPGEGASFGNAGCINGSSVVPVAMPGVLKSVPRWLLNADGPLVLRWQYLPRLMPWLLRFVASSHPAKVEAQARVLRALMESSLADYAPLVRDARAERFVHEHGHLVAYTTEAGYTSDDSAMRLRTRNGVVIDEITEAQLRDLEPDLAPDFIRARRIAETGHVSDPGRFTKQLAREAAARGARFLTADIRGVQTDGMRVTGVVTSAGIQPASAVVVALGAWSASIVSALGDRVLLDTERGYHIEVPDAQALPRVPTLWYEGKMFATPMDGRVRCAGTVELAGLDAPPDWSITRLLERQLEQMYPAIADDIARVGNGALPRWLGFRPSTPDSLPVIGPSGQFSNAVYAFGHGHVGLTAAASTGKVVARIIAGRSPGIELAPLSIGRFR